MAHAFNTHQQVRVDGPLLKMEAGDAVGGWRVRLTAYVDGSDFLLSLNEDSFRHVMAQGNYILAELDGRSAGAPSYLDHVIANGE